MSIYKSSTLAMIPTAYKDGKLYSVRPTDGSGDFTFSRGTTATRVASSGYIEKGRENLSLYSNTFSSWTAQSGGSVTSGQSGYDGTNDAWLLTSGAATYSRIERTISHTGVYTISVYAKAGTLGWLSFENSGISSDESYFDLTTGTLGSLGANVVTANIESVGSGWYRCSATLNGTSATQRIYPAVANGDLNSAQGNIYIQDFQFEQGLVATNYIETTTTSVSAGILEDMPRLDYSGGASCPALLLEPQRSNLFPHSEYYSAGGWSINNGTLTTNYAVSPEGLQNASKINFSSGGEIVRTTTFTAGQAYTFSFYAKVESGTFDFTYGNIDYTLISGTATTEWQRFEVTQTAPVVTRFPKIDATDTGDLLIWGAQIEQGSYPTSYIPTYGASVTRSVDTFKVTGISDLIDTQGGVMLLETQALDRNQGYSGVSLSDDTFTNNAQIRYGSATDQVQVQYRVGSSNECLASNSENDITNNLKIAFKYEADSFKMFVNGVLEATDTSGSVNAANTFDTIKSDRGDGGDKYLGRIKQLVVFPTALTDSECIALTTL